MTLTKPTWLSFLPLDVREALSVANRLMSVEQEFLLTTFIKFCVLSSDSYCVVNPLSLVEDEVSFRLAHQLVPLIYDGAIRFSSNEPDLREHFEKKALEYRGLSDDYGLSRVQFLLNEIYPIARIHPRIHSIGEAISQSFASEEFFIKHATRFGYEFSEMSFRVLPEAAMRLRSEQRSLTQKDFATLGLSDWARDRRSKFQTLVAYFQAHALREDHTVLSNLPFFEHLDLIAPAYSNLRFDQIWNYLSTTGLLNPVLSISFRGLSSLMSRRSFLGLARTLRDIGVRSQGLRGPGYWDHSSILQLVGGCNDEGAIDKIEAILSNLNITGGVVSELISISSETKREEDRSMPEVPRKAKKVGVFIALREEYEVFKRALQVESADYSKPVRKFELPGLEVYAICPNHVGRVTAAIETMRLIDAVRDLNCVFALGIAGGFEPKGVLKGDVLVLRSVHDGALRKRKVKETQFRPREFQCDEEVYRFFESDDFDRRSFSEAVINRDPEDWPEARRPAIHTTFSAVSLDEVVADDEYVAKLMEHYPNVACIEMESGGVAAVTKFRKLPFYCIRAVSDFADPMKGDDKWRKLAMRAVCEAFLQIPPEVL